MSKTNTPLTIVYNDEFDKEHYPIQDWHREVLARIEAHYNLPETASWFYHATIHGAIFSLKDDRYSDRIHFDTLVFLNTLKGFRWIETTDKKLVFGLSHNA
jgi:hypothetical protein